jgi:hypothetical protein
MCYSEESKSYQLFDPIKKQIVIRRNVIFDEKYSEIKLLNTSSGLLPNDTFDILADNRYHVPFFNVSTG